MKTLTLMPLELQMIERALNYVKWSDCEQLHNNLKKLLEYGRENHETCEVGVMQWVVNKQKGA